MKSGFCLLSMKSTISVDQHRRSYGKTVKSANTAISNECDCRRWLSPGKGASSRCLARHKLLSFIQDTFTEGIARKRKGAILAVIRGDTAKKAIASSLNPIPLLDPQRSQDHASILPFAELHDIISLLACGLCFPTSDTESCKHF